MTLLLQLTDMKHKLFKLVIVILGTGMLLHYLFLVGVRVPSLNDKIENQRQTMILMAKYGEDFEVAYNMAISAGKAYSKEDYELSTKLLKELAPIDSKLKTDKQEILSRVK